MENVIIFRINETYVKSQCNIEWSSKPMNEWTKKQTNKRLDVSAHTYTHELSTNTSTLS